MTERERSETSIASAIRVAQVSEETRTFLGFQKLRSKLMTHNANWPSPRPGTATQVAREEASNALKHSCEEDNILRCFGAAVILQWDTLPAKLQKELYENVSTLAEMLGIDSVAEPVHITSDGSKRSDDEATEQPLTERGDDAGRELDERTFTLGQR